MRDWFLNLSIPWMAFIIFAATYVVAACVYLAVVRLAVGDRAKCLQGVITCNVTATWDHLRPAVGYVGELRFYVVHVQQSSAQQPGIASVYLQCIAEPDSHRSVCEARAKSFGERASSEVPAEWPWVTFAPVFVVWILAYIAVWLGRWIVAPVAPPTRKANE